MKIEINDEIADEIVQESLKEAIEGKFEELQKIIETGEVEGIYSFDITDEKVAVIKSIAYYEHVLKEYGGGFKITLDSFLKKNDINMYNHFENVIELTKERDKYLQKSEILQEELDELKEKLKGLL